MPLESYKANNTCAVQIVSDCNNTMPSSNNITSSTNNTTNNAQDSVNGSSAHFSSEVTSSSALNVAAAVQGYHGGAQQYMMPMQYYHTQAQPYYIPSPYMSHDGSAYVDHGVAASGQDATNTSIPPPSLQFEMANNGVYPVTPAYPGTYVHGMPTSGMPLCHTMPGGQPPLYASQYQANYHQPYPYYSDYCHSEGADGVETEAISSRRWSTSGTSTPPTQQYQADTMYQQPNTSISTGLLTAPPQSSASSKTAAAMVRGMTHTSAAAPPSHVLSTKHHHHSRVVATGAGAPPPHASLAVAQNPAALLTNTSPVVHVQDSYINLNIHPPNHMHGSVMPHTSGGAGGSGYPGATGPMVHNGTSTLLPTHGAATIHQGSLHATASQDISVPNTNTSEIQSPGSNDNSRRVYQGSRGRGGGYNRGGSNVGANRRARRSESDSHSFSSDHSDSRITSQHTPSVLSYQQRSSAGVPYSGNILNSQQQFTQMNAKKYEGTPLYLTHATPHPFMYGVNDGNYPPPHMYPHALRHPTPVPSAHAPHHVEGAQMAVPLHVQHHSLPHYPTEPQAFTPQHHVQQVPLDDGISTTINNQHLTLVSSSSSSEVIASVPVDVNTTSIHNDNASNEEYVVNNKNDNVNIVANGGVMCETSNEYQPSVPPLHVVNDDTVCPNSTDMTSNGSSSMLNNGAVPSIENINVVTDEIHNIDSNPSSRHDTPTIQESSVPQSPAHIQHVSSPPPVATAHVVHTNSTAPVNRTPEISHSLQNGVGVKTDLELRSVSCYLDNRNINVNWDFPFVFGDIRDVLENLDQDKPAARSVNFMNHGIYSSNRSEHRKLEVVFDSQCEYVSRDCDFLPVDVAVAFKTDNDTTSIAPTESPVTVTTISEAQLPNAANIPAKKIKNKQQPMPLDDQKLKGASPEAVSVAAPEPQFTEQLDSNTPTPKIPATPVQQQQPKVATVPSTSTVVNKSTSKDTQGVVKAVTTDKLPPPPPKKQFMPQEMPASSPPSAGSAWGKRKNWGEQFKSDKKIATVTPFSCNGELTLESSVELTPDTTVACSETKTVSSAGVIDVGTPDAQDVLLKRTKIGGYLASYAPNYTTSTLQPRGLTNKQYWCYVNTILQALVSIPQFVNLFESIERQMGDYVTQHSLPMLHSIIGFLKELSPMNPTSINQTTRSFKKSNSNVINLPEIHPGDPFEPTTIQEIVKKDKRFSEGCQQDAEEMLSFILNESHEEMIECMKLVEKKKASNAVVMPNGHTEDDSNSDEWVTMLSKNKSCITRTTEFSQSPISKIFWGVTRSVFKKANGMTSANLEPFMTLPLNIQNEKITSVKEAMEQWFSKDDLSASSDTQDNHTVSSQRLLEQLPEVLILQLERFVYDESGLRKITKDVTVSIDLDITKELAQGAKKKHSAEKSKYKLVSIIYHDGKDANKGHYICDVYHAGYKCWLHYDDACVKAITSAELHTHNGSRVPYILFYRREDTFMDGNFPVTASSNNKRKNKRNASIDKRESVDRANSVEEKKNSVAGGTPVAETESKKPVPDNKAEGGASKTADGKKESSKERKGAPNTTNTSNNNNGSNNAGQQKSNNTNKRQENKKNKKNAGK